MNSGTDTSDSECECELWRKGVYPDEDPTYLDTFDSRDKAKEDLVRRAEFADLLYSDYEIREIAPDTERGAEQ